MTNNTITVMKKELARFFGDRRLVITTLLLPGIMIYVVYSFLGSVMMKTMLPEDTYVAKAYVVDMPDSVREEMRELRVDWQQADREQLTEIRQEIQEKQVDGLVVFPADFDTVVENYQVSSGEPAPNVEIYYNSAETESAHFYNEVSEVLEQYETSLANKLDINAGDSVYYDCATSKDTTGQMFSMMMPLLLMMFLYSGCMSVAPESIAGEKERGTIATLLVSSGEPAPNVEIYYNSAETESAHFYNEVSEVLEQYETSLANKLDINAGDSVYYDCATSKDTTGQMFSMMMPLLLMMFLYSGCMSVAPESIAGEKERGTIATLLVTPMKRSSLALGKVFSLSIIALLAGCSSFIGTFAALPKMMGGELTGVDSSVYVPMDYAMLLLIILSTVMVLVSMIALVSAFAKSVKEAATTVSPFTIVVTFIGLSPMLSQGKEIPLYRYLIPVYNSVQCMNGIFSFSYQPAEILLTVIVNLCVAGVLVFGLTRAFQSEKIIYS